MAKKELTTAELLKGKEQLLLATWMEAQLASITLRPDLMNEAELRKQSTEFLRALVEAIASGNLEDITAPEYDAVNAMLADIASSRAVQGFTPSETAIYVFSLKDSILAFLQEHLADQPEVLNREVNVISKLLDKLGLVSFETYAQGREQLINQQHQRLIEMLATPVLRIWEEVLVMPLIGTIDTPRAQQIMEKLLQSIVDTESTVAILDVTGVPVVDTRVAQHLLTTIQAANMLGAQCIMTGVNPYNAQTMVKLGIDLSGVITRGTLQAGLEEALRIVGFRMMRVEK